MPFYKSIQISDDITAYFWQITEDYQTLFRSVRLKDTSLARLEKMKSESHQKGFLAVRMLLEHLGYSDFDLFYDEFGKPHLQRKEKREKEAETLNISISHSFDFSCICISKNIPIGIDIEILKPKILKIAPRFMDVSHLEGLSEDDQILKATIIWGIKESVFKIKNEKGISFPEHIFEDCFSLSDKCCTANLYFNNHTEKFTSRFYNLEDYIFVCVIPN
ncbi:MAG TPA: 4'-phosphopantetheinyl transferase superfamily protein [Flavobacterium sp.]|nr:4'-phosphopantetheinyl transferase superfamily protein [Flavobacterium sp.]